MVRNIWSSLAHTLSGEARKSQSHRQVEEVMAWLRVIADSGGEYSKPGLLPLGRTLLFSPAPTILAPCCPDYGHKDGQYDFSGLRGGISLLAQRQIEFLMGLSAQGFKLPVCLMYADQEAEDIELCRVVQQTRESFIGLVESSIRQTSLIVPTGWQVRKFSEILPLLSKEEGVEGQRLLCEEEAVINRDAHARRAMYERINPRFTWEQMQHRTARTAAQYLILGRWAAQNGYIISNHTTVNLQWYRKTEVGLIHNPIKVY